MASVALSAKRERRTENVFHILLSAFFNAVNCYIILKGGLLPNTWASQQHKYLKHGGREPVASKKMSLG